MNIVTVMNYSMMHNLQTKMCLIWVDMLFARNKNCNLTVLHDGTLSNNGSILNKLKEYNCNIEHCDSADENFNLGVGASNIFFKMYNLCKLEYQFLYIDADAFVFDSLDELWACRNEKPYIAINHQKIPKHTDIYPPFLNGGVQLVGDPKFLSYERIMGQFKSDGEIRLVPGVEQPILYGYFKAIDYDYTHPRVGVEWNASSITTNVFEESGYYILRFKEDNRPAHINHYWNEYKPWNINCPVWRGYANKT